MAIDNGLAPNYATAFADQATWDLFSAGILTAVKTGGNVVGSGLGNLGGKWVNVNESMSGASRTYQRYIAGTDEVWLQNGVKFDGIKNGVLVEAKGNYANFVDKNTGKFYNWFTGDKGLIDQANRQLTASNGLPINWYFADGISMNAVSKLFKEKGISDINLIFKPLK